MMYGEVNTSKVLNFHENYFTFSKPVKLYLRGKWGESIPAPATVNGKTIYSSQDKSLEKKPEFTKGFDLSQYIYEKLHSYFENLPNGKYALHTFNMVVNEKGELIYFDFDKLKWTPLSSEEKSFSGSLASNNQQSVYHQKDTLLILQSSLQDLINQLGLDKPVSNTVTSPTIPKEAEKAIYRQLYNILKSCPKFKPAVKDGKAVPSVLFPPKYGFTGYIIVENHKTSLLRLFL